MYELKSTSCYSNITGNAHGFARVFRFPLTCKNSYIISCNILFYFFKEGCEEFLNSNENHRDGVSTAFFKSELYRKNWRKALCIGKVMSSHWKLMSQQVTSTSRKDEGLLAKRWISVILWTALFSSSLTLILLFESSWALWVRGHEPSRNDWSWPKLIISGRIMVESHFQLSSSYLVLLCSDGIIGFTRREVPRWRAITRMMLTNDFGSSGNVVVSREGDNLRQEGWIISGTLYFRDRFSR